MSTDSEDQTLDTVPTDFEGAAENLTEHPAEKVEGMEDNFGCAGQIIKKISFLTAVVVQNDQAGRLASSGEDDKMSLDFVELIRVKMDLFRNGNLPKMDREKYNEIARQQTKLHPMTETKTEYFG